MVDGSTSRVSASIRNWDWDNVPQFLSSLCLFFCTGGCFGCCGKSTPTTQVDEPSNRLTIQGQNRNNPSISDEFWSTSTFEMEQSGQRRITTSTPSLDQHGGGSTHSPPEFINYGLVLWNQTREKWTENRRHKTKLQQVREPMLSWNATYENLLGTNKPFPQSMPLSEMVDFFVDIWEHEGLYD